MSSLLYLTRKSMKNKLLQLRRKPALLVLYLFFGALIVFSFVSARDSGQVPGGIQHMDMGWLKLIFFGYVLLFAFSSVYSGLSNGASVFEMSDANFLFVSPVNPKQILVYGLVQQAAKSIAASVFILMLGNTLSNIWDIGISGLIYLFMGYVLAMVLFQLVAVVIYMYASRHPHIKKVVAGVCIALLLPLLAAVLVPYLQGVPVDTALLNAVNGNIFFTVPVAGWLTQLVFALVAGNYAAAALAGGLCVAGAGLAVLLLTVGKSDYYEDVLVATETAFQRKQAAAQGDFNAVDASSTRKVTLRKEGRGLWGQGAQVFLSKHLLEVSRKNRLKLLDGSSISFILVAWVMAFFMRGEEGVSGILVTTMVLRTMLIGTGLGMKELYSHYIFMVPASSFSKLVWSNLEILVKSLVESVLAFGVAGAILGDNVGTVLLSMAVTAVFAVMLVAVNLLSMRIFSSVVSQGLLLTFYFLFVAIVMVPGIVALVLCMVFVPGLAGTLLGLGALALWEALMAALFFFLSRGVLDTCDIETMPKSTR